MLNVQEVSHGDSEHRSWYAMVLRDFKGLPSSSEWPFVLSCRYDGVKSGENIGVHIRYAGLIRLLISVGYLYLSDGSLYSLI